jgi:hypothetical protein
MSLNKKPSPAMVVAVLALSVALAGSAVAGTDVANKLTKAKVRAIANKRIDKRAPGLSVAEADLADRATLADKATTADNATLAAKATLADKATSADAVGPNGVNTDAIVNGAVDTPKLASESVTSGKIVDGAVHSTDLGTLTERQASTVIADGTGGAVQVSCAAGERAISGGNSTVGVGVSAGWSTIRNGPAANGWDAAARNETGSSGTLVVKVLCLEP